MIVQDSSLEEVSLRHRKHQYQLVHELLRSRLELYLHPHSCKEKTLYGQKDQSMDICLQWWATDLSVGPDLTKIKITRDYSPE